MKGKSELSLIMNLSAKRLNKVWLFNYYYCFINTKKCVCGLSWWRDNFELFFHYTDLINRNSITYILLTFFDRFLIVSNHLFWAWVRMYRMSFAYCIHTDSYIDDIFIAYVYGDKNKSSDRRNIWWQFRVQTCAKSDTWIIHINKQLQASLWIIRSSVI